MWSSSSACEPACKPDPCLVPVKPKCVPRKKPCKPVCVPRKKPCKPKCVKRAEPACIRKPKCVPRRECYDDGRVLPRRPRVITTPRDDEPVATDEPVIVAPGGATVVAPDGATVVTPDEQPDGEFDITFANEQAKVGCGSCGGKKKSIKYLKNDHDRSANKKRKQEQRRKRDEKRRMEQQEAADIWM